MTVCSVGFDGLLSHGVELQAQDASVPLRGPQGRRSLRLLLTVRTSGGVRLKGQDCPTLDPQCVSPSALSF